MARVYPVCAVSRRIWSWASSLLVSTVSDAMDCIVSC